MTFDRYGHLMRGSRDEIRERMDAYLERAPALEAQRAGSMGAPLGSQEAQNA